MGGSSAPAAPNYTPIANADEAAAKLQQQTANQQLGWAQQQFAINQNEIQPLISSETQAAQTQNQNAQASYNRYINTEVPLQNQYLSEANQYSNPAYAAQQAGTAIANTDSAYTGARNQEQQQLNMYGADAGTARAGAINSNLGSQEAAAKAAAGTSSAQNTRLTGLNLQANAENMMSGLAGQSTSEYGGANSAGSTASGNALGLTSSGASTEGTSTEYSGLAANSLNNWGNTLSSAYNAQLGQFQANQQASSGFGSVLGTIGGLGAGLFEGAGYARGGGVLPTGYAHGGMAIPDNVSYARGGPITPKGAGRVPTFHVSTNQVKVFRPHLMKDSHPHTSSGVGAGGTPRMSASLNVRGLGGGAAGAAHGSKGPGAMPMNIDNKNGGLPGGGTMGGGYGGGGPSMALAEGGAIPSSQTDPYGRADNIPVSAKAGSYVVPKSVVDKLGTHHLDKIVAKEGSPEDRKAAHLRLQGLAHGGGVGGGHTHILMSAGEYMVPKSVVDKLGTHHFDKLVAQHGDTTDRQAAEARLAGQPSGAGNGPPIPANQLAAAAPARVKLGAIPMGAG